MEIQLTDNPLTQNKCFSILNLPKFKGGKANEKRMKRKSGTLIHRIILIIMAVIFIIANVAMYLTFDLVTKLTNNMGLDLENEEVQSVQTEAKEFTKQITEEGIVLLRNENNALPLEKGSNINLFGWSSTQMIAGGSGGSAGASVNIRTSLEDAGFAVNEELWDMYVSYKAERDIVPEEEYGGYSPSWETPEPEITDSKYYTEELLDNAKEFSDTAVFTIGRGSGEGLDIPAGYLTLTDTEISVLKYLRENYSKVILLVNSNSAVELGPAEEIGLDAVLFMPGPGDMGAAALGEILCGDVNPSGHLVDTFAYDHQTSPAYWYANRPGTMEYSDMEGYYYVDYVEGIYVGYKYYETAAEEGYIDYDSTVQYPFGYGLSYTTFSKEVTNVSGDLDSDEITVDVKVTNTGDTAGKDVVQIYAEAPYYEGGTEKASVDLVGFDKTELLEPGEEETVTIHIDPFEIASYDWNDANGDGEKGYILEAGDYQLKLMENSHDLIDVAAEFTLDEDILINEDPVTGTEIVNLFDDTAGQDETEPVQYLSRADFAGTFPEEKSSNVGRAASETDKAVEDLAYEDDPDAEAVTTGADNGLTVEDMKGLDYDDPLWDDLLDQLTFEEMENVITNGAFATPEIPSVGQGATAESDGPQGINAWVIGLTGVSYPVEMYVGQTWNPDIAEQQGHLLGRESRASGLSGLYAPSVNIHRTPYSGRNFEYYSEDGFMAGKLAAKMTYAAREEGVFMTVKHFALNDQETYRGEYFTSLFTWCNEQAMREIYLKPFEIAVKEGQATAVMTSMNRIGSVWAGASRALLTDLLRNEWGFRGLAITDMYVGSMNNEWWMDSEQGIRAGQDLWLGMWYQPGELDIDETNLTSQNAMRQACKNILYTFVQTEVSPAEPHADWFYHIALPIDIIYAAAMIAYLVFIIRKTRKNKRQDRSQHN
mgnify:FL=1